ncbi:MAG: peptide-methionine (S)-S-oxide reductase MsrA [Candidatus Kariarchaeaceae archaeon]|jgi:peptide-methionine (S)-S-oxide reductase
MSQQEIATLGGGCFWCIDAVYEELQGIESSESGYSGGKTENPTYEEVCRGTGGHAEVVQVKFDPEVISFREILEVFFFVHDPTTLNRQGNDVGPQYRSVIYYHSPEQKEIAEQVIKELEEKRVYNNPIVTEIAQLNDYYVAEEYHQSYFRKNPNQGYCTYVISPKVSKFRKKYFDRLQAKVN